MAEVVSTLKPSGGDYTLLSAWEAANQSGTWATDGDVPVLECYTGDYTSSGGGVNYIVDALVIDGWTDIDATHAPVVRAAPGHEYDGNIANGLTIRKAGEGVLKAYAPFCRVENLKFEVTASMSTWNAAMRSNSDTIIDGCHLEISAPAVANTYLMSARGTGGTPAILRNCTLKMIGTSSLHYGVLTSSVGAGSRCDVYNCTFDDMGRAIYGGDSNNCNFKNNVFISSSSDDLYRIGSSPTATNATSKSSSAGCSIFNILTTDFVDFTGGDYHLDSGATALIGSGTDLSASFTKDIDGETRVAPWDVGVDQYVAGGSAAALESNATAQATATAEATTAIPLAGATLSVATAEGVISTSVDMEAASSAISLLNGNIDTEIRVSVAAIAQALSQAGLDVQTLFAAAAVGQADSSGTLSGTGADLSAAAQAIADSNASISVAITMQGDAIAQALATANLTSNGSGLSGSATAQALVAGAISTAIELIGTSTAVVTAQGGIDTILRLQAAAAATSSALGGLTTYITLNAQALIQALAQAELTTGEGFSGDATAVAVSTGWLKIEVTFDGVAVSEALARGDLTVNELYLQVGTVTSTVNEIVILSMTQEIFTEGVIE